ncbi:MAG: hypothetical protein FJ044_02850 [Candidatus Cloacimonetes bacterium]|nr:hypothetical protein [Candidatus Cloacimonadota bacterium]
MTENQETKGSRAKQFFLFNSTSVLISLTFLFFAVVVVLKDKLLLPALFFGGVGALYFAVFIWEFIKYWKMEKVLVELGKAISREKSAEEK